MEVVGDIFVTVDFVIDWEEEAVGEILAVSQLVETTKMVGWEVVSVREISVIAKLAAEVNEETLVMVVWILRYVETSEIARVYDGLTNMMALEAFC